MQTKELDTKKAGFFAWAASRDAAIKSYAASTGYTDAQKLQAERVRLGLELCYHQSAIHINFRQKFIVVKIDNPQVKDRKNLKVLENDYSNMGITKQILKAGGIGYRIPRDN